MRALQGHHNAKRQPNSISQEQTRSRNSFSDSYLAVCIRRKKICPVSAGLWALFYMYAFIVWVFKAALHDSRLLKKMHTGPCSSDLHLYSFICIQRRCRGQRSLTCALWANYLKILFLQRLPVIARNAQPRMITAARPGQIMAPMPLKWLANSRRWNTPRGISSLGSAAGTLLRVPGDEPSQAGIAATHLPLLHGGQTNPPSLPGALTSPHPPETLPMMAENFSCHGYQFFTCIDVSLPSQQGCHLAKGWERHR